MIHRVAKCCLHEKTSMFKKNGGGSCPQVPVVVGTKYLLVGTRYYIKETRKKKLMLKKRGGMGNQRHRRLG